MSNKGYFAQRAAAKKAAQRRENWNRIGNDVQVAGTGVTMVATLIGGIAALVNATKSSKTDREITRTDQLVSLSLDAQTAEKGAQRWAHRRQARNTRKQAERALEALAARRADAEAQYAQAVHQGVQLHRSVPQPTPIWWPKGVS